MALEPAMTAFTSREALAMRISALIATELDRGARLNGSAAIAVSIASSASCRVISGVPPASSLAV